MMTNKDQEFINIYNSYFGGEIDNPQQLKKHSFNGEELKEFVEYVLSYRYKRRSDLYSFMWNNDFSYVYGSDYEYEKGECTIYLFDNDFSVIIVDQDDTYIYQPIEKMKKILVEKYPEYFKL